MINIFKFFLLFTLLVSAESVFAQQTEREKGIEVYQKGDYQGAIQILKKAVKTDSSDAESWYFLGLSYFNKDDAKDSLKAFKKAVELNGQDSRARVGLAYVYLIKNNLQEAQKEAQEAIKLNGKNAEAHYVLGVINFRNNSFNYAYERARKALEMNPNLAAAYLLKTESLVSSFSQQTGTVIKSQNARKELLKEAAWNLEKYISLALSNKETEFQREYLQSLEFFAQYYDAPENNLPNSLDVNEQINVSKTPVKILSKPPASYTERARGAGITGTIRLLVGFAVNGNVRHILVLKPLSHGLNEEAVRAARGIKFEPATQDGKPISVVKIIEYSFSIY